jgi:ubiquinone/menaquinone biosynthesis C-methylase UbiE
MSKALAEVEFANRGELVACDGTNMPFEDETFAMVVSKNGDPYYVPKKDLLTSLREKHRVMRVGATALLCPAICEYGEHEITEEDIAPLQTEIDVSICPIPASGHHMYSSDTRNMLVIRK